MQESEAEPSRQKYGDSFDVMLDKELSFGDNKFELPVSISQLQTLP